MVFEEPSRFSANIVKRATSIEGRKQIQKSEKTSIVRRFSDISKADTAKRKKIAAEKRALIKKTASRKPKVIKKMAKIRKKRTLNQTLDRLDHKIFGSGKRTKRKKRKTKR